MATDGRTAGQLGRRHGLPHRPRNRRAADSSRRRGRRVPDMGRHRPFTIGRTIRRADVRTVRLDAGPGAAARAGRRAAGRFARRAPPHRTRRRRGPARSRLSAVSRPASGNWPAARRRASGGRITPAGVGLRRARRAPREAWTGEGSGVDSLPPAEPDGSGVRPPRTRADRRARHQARSGGDQRRDPCRVGPPRPRSHPLCVHRPGGDRAHHHVDVGIEGVQPRRPTLGDPARRAQGIAQDRCRPSGALPRRPEPARRGSHRGGVVGRRRVARCRAGAPRSQPATSRRAVDSAPADDRVPPTGRHLLGMARLPPAGPR